MTRLLIMLGSLAFIVIWVAGRWLIRRRRDRPARPPVAAANELERWYRAAQEQMASMDDGERRRRIGRWDRLPEAERLAVAESFLRERFGAPAIRRLSRGEKLALGRVHEATRDQA